MTRAFDDGDIPFLDLVTPHVELEEELVGVFRAALRSGRFAGGAAVESFEAAFAAFCSTRHCVTVSSGTDALRFALLACGIGKGEAVVTTPSTFIATAEAITQAGAVPQFVDVEERSSTIDAGKLRHFFDGECDREPVTGRPVVRRNRRTIAALIPVHLYGQMADMDPLIEIAEDYNLTIVEDACQAHGAEYISLRERRPVRAGVIGRAAAFSFYPGKNLGACGEAGAVTTDDESLADQVRMLRDHGQRTKYLHEVEGYNGRIDAIQAGILSVKLRYLPEWTRRRRELAARYNDLLRDCPGVRTPEEAPRRTSVYHLYVIHTDGRDGLQRSLRSAGIGTGLHYPKPLHLQAAYSWLGCKEGDFPVAERNARALLSLPLYPQMTFEQVERVASLVREHATGGRRKVPSEGRGVGTAGVSGSSERVT